MGPHLLRHCCGIQLLRAGADVFTVQKVLGHATLVMTRRYCELADSDVHEKHALFSPADRLRTAATGTRRRLR
jgi:site-specific recombinase XerD